MRLSAGVATTGDIREVQGTPKFLILTNPRDERHSIHCWVTEERQKGQKAENRNDGCALTMAFIGVSL